MCWQKLAVSGDPASLPKPAVKGPASICTRPSKYWPLLPKPSAEKKRCACYVKQTDIELISIYLFYILECCSRIRACILAKIEEIGLAASPATDFLKLPGNCLNCLEPELSPTGKETFPGTGLCKRLRIAGGFGVGWVWLFNHALNGRDPPLQRPL